EGRDDMTVGVVHLPSAYVDPACVVDNTRRSSAGVVGALDRIYRPVCGIVAVRGDEVARRDLRRQRSRRVVLPARGVRGRRVAGDGLADLAVEEVVLRRRGVAV